MPLSVQFASPGFLAWGWILVAIPILVHLLMRRKPSHYEFPTLRFLRAAQKKQSTRIKLQHLLLLLLRILLILLILLAFSRPQMRLRTSIWSHDEPVDAVLLVDTSPSMEALIGGGTTLDRARPWGRAFIGALPQGSRVAVMTSQLAPIEWSMRAHELDRKLAELEVQEGVSSMAPAIRRASKLFERMSDRRRVFYVLTDLTGIALPPKVFDGWAEQIPVHLVDLAGDGLSNLYLEQLSLSQTSVLRGTPVTVSGVVSGQGRAGRVTLDLIVAGRTLQSRPIEVTDGGRAPFRFVFPARTPGVMQGQVRIREQDVLPPDNALYFTVRVFRTLPLRVVSDPAFSRSSSWRWLKLALDPEEKGRRLATELLLPGQLAQRTLARSRILILPEVTGLTDEGWAAIEEFVSSGGGLLVLLGPDLRLPEWRTPKAREVLGMEIVGPERLSKPLGLARVDWAHPLLASFEAGKNGNLMDVEWLGVARIVAGGQAKVLARLAESGLPAILERPLGRGRMLVLSGGINPRWGELSPTPSYRCCRRRSNILRSSRRARSIFAWVRLPSWNWTPGQKLIASGSSVRVVRPGS